MTNTPPAITQEIKDALHAHGFTERDFGRLTPEEQQKFIATFNSGGKASHKTAPNAPPQQPQPAAEAAPEPDTDEASLNSAPAQPGKPPLEPEQPVEDAAPEAPEANADRGEGFITHDAARAHAAQAAVTSMSDITALRLHLRRGGFDPIPVEGKIPHMNGWQTKLSVGDAEIRLWEKSYHLAHNTGVLAKFAPGLDIDIMHEAAAEAVEMLAREFFEERGNIYVRFGKPPKRLILLRTDEPFTKLSRVFAEPKGPDGKEPKIEILGDGQQYVVDGTHSETGKPYSLFGGDLETIRRDDLPYVRREDIERFLDAATKLLVEEFGFTLKTAAGQQTNSGGDLLASGEKARTDGNAAPAERFEPASRLAHLDPDEGIGEGIEENRRWDLLPPEHKDEAVDHGLELIAKNSTLLQFEDHGGNNDQWYRLVTSVARSGAPHRADIFVKYAGAVPGADSEAELRKKLAYCEKNPQGITVGTFIYLARQCGADFEPWLEARKDGNGGTNGDAPAPQSHSSPSQAHLPLIVELGSKLWGPATANGKDYRFGADQSKVVDPIKSNWFDFAVNKGGHIRDLMKKVETEANRKQTNTDDVVLVCAADVVMRPLDWIWEGHLLRGSQELMSGLPDLCKSQVQIGHIACATARLPWPDGAPAIEPMNVIMLTAEDTLDQIVVPRLRAAGADISRVHILKCIKTDEHDRQFLLAEDLERLERLMQKIGDVGFVTMDPITAYMGSKMDSYKATEVRSQLGPLKDLSERTNIALSTITHPPKAAGPRAIDHFIASQAFIAACRVGHLCIAEMEEKDGERVPTGRVLYTNVRNAAHRLMPTLAYRKDEITISTEPCLITAPRVIWEGEVDITAEVAIAAASGKQPDLQPKVQAFLREMLKDDKPVLQKEIEEAAEKNGFTGKQLRTAREKLGVHVFKEPGKMGGPWFWQLSNPDEGRYHY
jgi:hypothetical protein